MKMCGANDLDSENVCDDNETPDLDNVNNVKMVVMIQIV